MRKFKVIALSVGANGNRICNAGEIVTEAMFDPGRADELVKQKFLEEVDSDEKEQKTEEKVEKADKEKPTGKSDNQVKDKKPGAKSSG